jgi:4-amino-4-deoxy-L-arabinose transferase-like glycosyltransferase
MCPSGASGVAAASRPFGHTAAMIWWDWSDYKRAQVVNGLVIAFLLVSAWRMSAANNVLWTWIFLAGAAVNMIGGVWRLRQKRRGVYELKRPNRPNV